LNVPKKENQTGGRGGKKGGGLVKKKTSEMEISHPGGRVRYKTRCSQVPLPSPNRRKDKGALSKRGRDCGRGKNRVPEKNA